MCFLLAYTINLTRMPCGATHRSTPLLVLRCVARRGGFKGRVFQRRLQLPQVYNKKTSLSRIANTFTQICLQFIFAVDNQISLIMPQWKVKLYNRYIVPTGRGFFFVVMYSINILSLRDQEKTNCKIILHCPAETEYL